MATQPVPAGSSARPLRVADLDTLDFGKGAGLLPAIVQHAGSGAVLMLGYMNREALVATLTRGRVVFFSRSKGRLWEKGETSGDALELAEINADCDRDALLVRAWPRGPACHLGNGSCFGDARIDSGANATTFLATLDEVIADRLARRPPGSYTAKLLEGGWRRIAQKVGEEALEVALAAVGGSDSEVINEASDLLYHLLVLLRARGLSLESVLKELAARHASIARTPRPPPARHNP